MPLRPLPHFDRFLSGAGSQVFPATHSVLRFYRVNHFVFLVARRKSAIESDIDYFDHQIGLYEEDSSWWFRAKMTCRCHRIIKMFVAQVYRPRWEESRATKATRGRTEKKKNTKHQPTRRSRLILKVRAGRPVPDQLPVSCLPSAWLKSVHFTSHRLPGRAAPVPDGKQEGGQHVLHDLVHQLVLDPPQCHEPQGTDDPSRGPMTLTRCSWSEPSFAGGHMSARMAPSVIGPSLQSKMETELCLLLSGVTERFLL